jgi:hypothetical protein
MNVCEPRVRRRGFFLHSSDTNDVETGEYENAEGFAVRFRTSRSTAPRRFSSGRQARSEQRTDEGQPQIRSGSVTGSRQRSHLPR